MRRASRRRISRSSATWSAAPARCAFTTTSRPSSSVAVCTWARDADASGAVSTSANTSSIGRPSSCVTICANTGQGCGGTRLVRCDNSAMNTGGIRSARVESIWPSFTNVTPASCSASRSDRAVSAGRSLDASPRSCEPRPCRAMIVLISP